MTLYDSFLHGWHWETPVELTARRDTMFSWFRVGPAISGRGLCDIDKVLFIVSKSRVRNLGCPSTAEIYRLLWISIIIGLFSSCHDFPIFWHVIYLLWIIPYRYRIVLVRWLRCPNEIPKTWNLSYSRRSVTCLDWITVAQCYQAPLRCSLQCAHPSLSWSW